MKDKSPKFKVEPKARLVSCDTPFTVPRSLLLNTALTWKAKGVATYIIAKKIVSGKAIIAMGRDGQSATYAAIRELEAASLVEYRVVKDKSGKILAKGYTWIGGYR